MSASKAGSSCRGDMANHSMPCVCYTDMCDRTCTPEGCWCAAVVRGYVKPAAAVTVGNEYMKSLQQYIVVVTCARASIITCYLVVSTVCLI